MSDNATEEIPRFNHIALSVPPDLIAGKNAEDILRFYEEVFGWGAMPTMVKDGELLVLRVHSNEQFVYLHGSEDPLSCPKDDHFGLQVSTPEALDAVYQKALSFQERDTRVEIDDKQIEDFQVLKLHSAYIRYLLPMRIELQCFDWQPGFDAASTG